MKIMSVLVSKIKDIVSNIKDIRRLLIDWLFFNGECFIVNCCDTVIVVPHPDDEIFGCAGLITEKRGKGAKVTLLMMTDGEASHKRCCCHTPPEDIGSTRRNLAYIAGAMIGLSPENYIWMELPDGLIPSPEAPEWKGAVESISDVLRQIEPAEVYAPVPFDGVRDHDRTYELVYAALGKMTNNVPLLVGYGVWIWHSLRLLDIWKLKGWRRYALDIQHCKILKNRAITFYLSFLNPKCGKPVCGNLSKKFIDHFMSKGEIYFLSKES